MLQTLTYYLHQLQMGKFVGANGGLCALQVQYPYLTPIKLNVDILIHASSISLKYIILLHMKKKHV